MGEIEASFMENVEKSFKRVKKHFDMLESEVRANREHIIDQTELIGALNAELSQNRKENKVLRGRIRELERISTGNEGVYSFIHSFIHYSLFMNKDFEAKNQKYDYVHNLFIREPEKALEAPKAKPEEDRGVQKPDNQVKIAEPEPSFPADDLEIESLEQSEIPVEKEEVPVVKKKNSVKIKPSSVEKVDFDLEKSLSNDDDKLSPIKALTEGKKELAAKFGSLSKQEFMTFLAVYQLEDDEVRVTYTSIAKKLNLTEGCIRTYVSSLIKKGLPVVKKRANNKFVFLIIDPEFRGLNLKKEIVDMYAQSNPKQGFNLF